MRGHCERPKASRDLRLGFVRHFRNGLICRNGQPLSIRQTIPRTTECRAVFHSPARHRQPGERSFRSVDLRNARVPFTGAGCGLVVYAARRDLGRICGARGRMVREVNPHGHRPFHGSSAVVCAVGSARSTSPGYFTHPVRHCDFYFARFVGMAVFIAGRVGRHKKSAQCRFSIACPRDGVQPLENDRLSPAPQFASSPFRAILDFHSGLCPDGSHPQHVGTRRNRAIAFLGKSFAWPRRYLRRQRKSLAAYSPHSADSGSDLFSIDLAGTGGNCLMPSPLKSLALSTLLTLALPVRAQTGGELHFCLHSEPKTFNPILVDDEASENVRYLTGGVLIRLNRQTQELEPALSTSWKVSRDRRAITFHLRKGIHFSDGTPFSSEDVAYTMRLLMDPETHSTTGDAFRSGEGVVQVRTPA